MINGHEVIFSNSMSFADLIEKIERKFPSLVVVQMRKHNQDIEFTSIDGEKITLPLQDLFQIA